VSTIHGKQYVEMSLMAQDMMSLKSHGLMCKARCGLKVGFIFTFTCMQIKKQLNGEENLLMKIYISL